MKQTDYIKYEMSKGGNLEEYKDIKILTLDSKIGGELKPCLKVWIGKQSNPKMNYYYNHKEHRSQSILKAKEQADAREEYKEKRKAEKKAFTPELNIGDIYSSSWGYEQTNINFYQVIEIKGKATVVIKEIAQDIVKDSMYSHGMACEVMPVKDEFLNDRTLVKRVGQYGIRINSVASARKWKGTPEYKSWYA